LISQPPVENVRLSIGDGLLRITVISRYSVELQILQAKEKADLMKSAFGLQGIIFEHSKKQKASET